MLNQSIQLLDLIKKERLDEILQGFTEVSGVASVITTPDGHPITESHNFTSFCQKFCRSTEEGQKKCYESDSYGGAKSLELKEPFVYKCLNAGLIDGGVPIIVEGYHLANFVCGQVQEEPMTSEEAIRRARAIGITDIEGYLEELGKVPQMTRVRLLTIVNFMSAITRNISEQALHKYLLDKQSRKYLNKLVNSVSDCIISTNSELKIIMVNDAGAQAFGIDAKILCGQSLFTLLADDVSKAALKRQKEFSCQGTENLELTALKNGNQPFPVLLSLSRISNGRSKEPDYVAVLRDISEEKKVERMKEDLVGMLTHDMGNPVLSIKSALQLLLAETLGPLNPGQREIMELALSTNRQLHGMVDNFLDIYRSENGQFLLRKQNLDMVQMIQEGINQLKLFAREKQLSLIFDSPFASCILNGDRNRLKRTFINLLANAIKYSLDAGEIRVELAHVTGGDERLEANFGCSVDQRLKREQDYLLITVSDQGYGIPEKYQQAVFEKFFSLESANEGERRGLGLGLNFCKLVVEAHGGSICARTPLKTENNKKTPGCQFFFVLPLNSWVLGSHRRERVRR